MLASDYPDDSESEREAQRYFDATADELSQDELVGLARFHGRLAARYLAQAAYHGTFATKAPDCRHRRRADEYDRRADLVVDQLGRYFDRVAHADIDLAAALEAEYEVARELALHRASRRCADRLRKELVGVDRAATPAGVN